MEIGYTAVSITLVDVVVFLPIVFSKGLVADLMRQFSVVIVTSTLISLFVSFTLVPWLASRFAKRERLSDKTWIGRRVIAFENGLGYFSDWLSDSLLWAFNHKLITLFVAFLLFVSALTLVPAGFIGTEFTKAGDRGEFILELEMPKNSTLRNTDYITLQTEEYLMHVPEVLSVFTNVGLTSSGRIESSSAYLAEINVKLIDKTQRKFSTSYLARKIKLDLEGNIPGLKVRPIEINILGLRGDDAVQVAITGVDLAEVLNFSEKVAIALEEILGSVEITSSVTGGNPEISVEVEREKLANLGLTLGSVGAAMQVAFNGNRDAKYRESEFDYDINVQLAAFDRQNISDIRNLTVINNKGQIIPLKQFSIISESLGPSALERTNRISSVTIKCQVVGKPAGTVSNELKEKLEDMDVPEGVSYAFGGQTKRQTESFQTLAIALITSILLVYLIMVALYDSYFYPFVVLFSIPLAVIGAMLVLALTNQSLSIFSILGVIMLVGLVGKNVILVVDFTNKLKQQGMELKAALVQATRMRFRPILMTNLTMIFGLMPIAMASGAGSEWKNGLAWALIGGLSSSMFLSLIVVPVVYYMLDSWLKKIGWHKMRKIKVPLNNV